MTTHCNLSCYGCDHASPVRVEEYLSVEDLAADLAALSEVYHVFEFFVTGGEPLLHPKLLDVIDTIRESGVAEKIALVTNGALLHRAPDELWRRIDKMWVSIYPGVKRRLSNDQIKARAEENGVLLRLKVTDEFTLKLLHSENSDSNLVEKIYSTCTLRESCHTINEGRYFKCSPGPFVPAWLRRVGIEPPDSVRDSVPLRDNPGLRQQLEDYLNHEEPLTACRYCLGCVGKPIRSRQMNKVAVEQWLSEEDPDARELVDWESLAEAQASFVGSRLTGMLPTMAREKARWLITEWMKRFLGVDLLTSPLTMRGSSARARLTSWTILSRRRASGSSKRR